MTMPDFNFKTISLRYYPQDKAAFVEKARSDPEYKASLYRLIEQSKTDDNIQFLASNAITVLAAAGEIFADKNFSGITIPLADVTGAEFLRTSLRNADLRSCNFTRCHFNHVDFSEANVGAFSLSLPREVHQLASHLELSVTSSDDLELRILRLLEETAEQTTVTDSRHSFVRR